MPKQRTKNDPAIVADQAGASASVAPSDEASQADVESRTAPASASATVPAARPVLTEPLTDEERELLRVLQVHVPDLPLLCNLPDEARLVELAKQLDDAAARLGLTLGRVARDLCSILIQERRDYCDGHIARLERQMDGASANLDAKPGRWAKQLKLAAAQLKSVDAIILQHGPEVEAANPGNLVAQTYLLIIRVKQAIGTAPAVADLSNYNASRR